MLITGYIKRLHLGIRGSVCAGIDGMFCSLLPMPRETLHSNASGRH